MKTLQPIVEGEGEVSSIRILLEKIIEWEKHQISVLPAYNAKGTPNIVKKGGIEYFLRIARRNRVDCALVLLDNDDDCARDLGWRLGERALALNLPFPVAIVCATREYEAWFLASLESLAGKYGFPSDLAYTGEVESKRGVKEWLSEQMPRDRRYSETRDQASMTARLDVDRVLQKSRSFQRLKHAIDQLVAGHPMVTPLVKRE